MITLDRRSTHHAFALHVSGKITRNEEGRLLECLEEAIEEYGRISVLIHIESLDTMELGAMWEELKFDFKHFRHFTRIAIVGDEAWHEHLLSFTRHLVTARWRHFRSAEMDEAWAWTLRADPADV